MGGIDLFSRRPSPKSDEMKLPPAATAATAETVPTSQADFGCSGWEDSSDFDFVGGGEWSDFESTMINAAPSSAPAAFLFHKDKDSTTTSADAHSSTQSLSQSAASKLMAMIESSGDTTMANDTGHGSGRPTIIGLEREVTMDFNHQEQQSQIDTNRTNGQTRASFTPVLPSAPKTPAKLAPTAADEAMPPPQVTPALNSERPNFSRFIPTMSTEASPGESLQQSDMPAGRGQGQATAFGDSLMEQHPAMTQGPFQTSLVAPVTPGPVDKQPVDSPTSTISFEDYHGKIIDQKQHFEDGFKSYDEKLLELSCDLCVAAGVMLAFEDSVQDLINEIDSALDYLDAKTEEIDC